MCALRIDFKVDEDRVRARRLVEHLYAVGKRLGDADVREAAILLDAYQAGLALATPDRETGYRLVRAGEEVLEVKVSSNQRTWKAEAPDGTFAFSPVSAMSAVDRLGTKCFGQDGFRISAAVAGNGSAAWMLHRVPA